MEHLIKALVEGSTRKEAEKLGRGVLQEMAKTSNPELALQAAKEKLARDVSAYSEEPVEVPAISKKAEQVLKWAKFAEQIEDEMEDDAVSAIVLELAASSDYPTSDDWDKYSFLFDAPNPHTEVVEPGGFPGDEPRPHDGWDLGDEDSMEPRRPKTKTYPK